jgi:uncharacterized protein (TIGR04222 family)
VSPFDLHGPEFLVFYLILGACVLFALWWTRRTGESDEPPAINLSDPYLIAYLRGGKKETLRVATVSLIDRGFLQVSGSMVAAARDRSASVLRAPLEQRLVSCFHAPAEAASAFDRTDLDREMDTYERELIRLDLLPDAEARSARAVRLGISLALLWGVALLKIMIATSRGRGNIQFLLALAIIFTIAAVKLTRPRLTRRGAAMTTSLGNLFFPLRDRAATLLPGANSNEILLLAAVYGVNAIPNSVFPHTKKLYPKADSSGSSCGSSCGSGCGGGGCGGGCGGCGS